MFWFIHFLWAEEDYVSAVVFAVCCVGIAALLPAIIALAVMISGAG